MKIYKYIKIDRIYEKNTKTIYTFVQGKHLRLNEYKYIIKQTYKYMNI